MGKKSQFLEVLKWIDINRGVRLRQERRGWKNLAEWGRIKFFVVGRKINH